MELLNPAHRDPIPGPSFGPRVDRPANTQFPESAEETGGFNAGEQDKVFIAVGKSVEKAVNLLQWTLKRFGGKNICLLHVHQPSPLIPTLSKDLLPLIVSLFVVLFMVEFCFPAEF